MRPPPWRRRSASSPASFRRPTIAGRPGSSPTMASWTSRSTSFIAARSRSCAAFGSTATGRGRRGRSSTRSRRRSLSSSVRRIRSSASARPSSFRECETRCSTDAARGRQPDRRRPRAQGPSRPDARVARPRGQRAGRRSRYAGLVDRFVLDEVDAELAVEVASTGLEPWSSRPSRSDDDRRRLAEALLDRDPWRLMVTRVADRYPARVSTRIIVPHRGLEAAKTRLATSLSPDERIFLASQLLQRVLGSRARSPMTSSASRRRARSSRSSSRRARGSSSSAGMGLNEGLEQARASTRSPTTSPRW